MGIWRKCLKMKISNEEDFPLSLSHSFDEKKSLQFNKILWNAKSKRKSIRLWKVFSIQMDYYDRIGSISFRKLMTKQINWVNRVQTSAKSIFICKQRFSCIKKEQGRDWKRIKTSEFHAVALMSYHFSVLLY